MALLKLVSATLFRRTYASGHQRVKNSCPAQSKRYRVLQTTNDGSGPLQGLSPKREMACRAQAMAGRIRYLPDSIQRESGNR